MRLQISNGFPGNGFFERLQESGDLLGMLPRIDQQMHVLGHQDVGPNLEAKCGAGSFQCFTKPLPCSFALKNAKPPIARKRQLPWLARLIETVQPFFPIMAAGVGVDDSHG